MLSKQWPRQKCKSPEHLNAPSSDFAPLRSFAVAIWKETGMRVGLNTWQRLSEGKWLNGEMIEIGMRSVYLRSAISIYRA
jgi:hypothetical protein